MKFYLANAQNPYCTLRGHNLIRVRAAAENDRPLSLNLIEFLVDLKKSAYAFQ
jgi:hypothetical protein